MKGAGEAARAIWNHNDTHEELMSVGAMTETIDFHFPGYSRMREALRKYGKHLTACACFDEFDEKACDCGFGKYEADL
jgi:hypothetical protein